MTINDVGRIGPQDNELEAIKKRNADLQFCLDKEVARVMALTQQNAELLAAAKDVIKRWDAPLWEERKPTSFYMHKLREAIAKAGGEA